MTYNPITKVYSLNQDTAVNYLDTCLKLDKSYALLSSTPGSLKEMPHEISSTISRSIHPVGTSKYGQGEYQDNRIELKLDPPY